MLAFPFWMAVKRIIRTEGVLSVTKLWSLLRYQLCLITILYTVSTVSPAQFRIEGKTVRKGSKATLKFFMTTLMMINKSVKQNMYGRLWNISTILILSRSIGRPLSRQIIQHLFWWKKINKPHLNSYWVYYFLGDCTWRPQPDGFQSAPFQKRELLKVLFRDIYFIFTCCGMRKRLCKYEISSLFWYMLTHLALELLIEYFKTSKPHFHPEIFLTFQSKLMDQKSVQLKKSHWWLFSNSKEGVDVELARRRQTKVSL